MGSQGIFNWMKLVHIIFAIIFLTSGLLINFVQFALYISLRKINKHWFRTINYYLNYSLFSQTLFLMQYWAKVKVILYVKRSDFSNYCGKEKVLLIMNHTYEIDWLIGWVLCDNCRVLGNCKTFAKKSIQYVPTLGFAWKLGGSIFLERVWDKDKTILETKLNDLTSYKDVFWLLLAAEGTRFTEQKHEVSKAFARKHGLPELRHHLTPRTKGFTTALPYLKGKVPAIYNINVGVRPCEVVPTFRNILFGKSLTASIYLERYPISDLPEDEEKQATWLHDLYKRKDDVLHSYLETGSWFKLSNVEECEGFYLPRRIFPLLNFIFWAVTILIPFGYFLTKLIISGNVIYIALAIAILYTINAFFNKIMGETNINKASSYGVKTTARAEKSKAN